ncbi:outer membrane protein transport protein [Helicobacter sp. MIT 14-3879]|uniref:outer membrane protein transport protein n=1 Tax=Helicobacter sp. MIT 14-3879 TaxID=2040649 RepID=UPI0021636788|nr:outer membrane protein transport protein [Helicobacter sp. MIT 14-3879]
MRILNKIKIYILLFVFTCMLHSSGFKINEQSLRSIALSSAYVAAVYGADSSYFNPANMGFLDGIREDKHDLEISLTAIYIPSFDFSTDTRTKKLGEGSINWGLTSNTTMKIPLSQTALDFAKFFGVNLDSLKDPIVLPHGGSGNLNQHGELGYDSSGAVVDGSADTTIFPVPKIFYKSKSFLNYDGGGFNVGVAFTAPSGLAMTWNGEAGAFLKDVMIAMIELSPSISYQYKEIIGIGISPRILYGLGNFNNTVYVPLNGSVLTNLKDYDAIPDEMVPAAMQDLIYQVNTATAVSGFAGLFVGGGAHWNNTERYNNPTLFNPDRWFGLPSVGALGDAHNISAYNSNVAQANAIMKNNWNHYQNEWANGNLEWRYNNKTCSSQTAICLPTLFNPVPNATYTTHIPNVGQAKGYKFINGVNYCIQNGNTTSGFFGCQNMGSIMDDASEIRRKYNINSVYVNCYTGTFYDYSGNLQIGNPGPCSYPSPSETDSDGAPRGYKYLWGAKEVAQAFGMGDMDITTSLEGSTKVDQRSNGADLAFGYRAGVTFRPINSKNYSLTISGVFDSPVKFKFKGKLDADTYIGGSIGDINMKADLLLDTQLPAQLKIGVAQRIYNLTLELVYERILWAGGKKFDFSFSNPTFSALNPNSIIAGFTKEQIESMMNLANYDAVAMGKGWKDTNAYRVGLTYRFDSGTILMASFAYDESPVPQDQIGIPDSTAYIVGGGINIPITNNLSIGASATVYLKDGSKSIYQSKDGLGKLVLANLSMGYSF